MPDGQGRLSPAEISYVLQWIANHHGGSPYICPVSGHNTWLVDEYVTQPILFPIQPNLGTSVAPIAWPVVRLICSGCGHMISFSAWAMGLYPAPPPPPPPLPRRV